MHNWGEQERILKREVVWTNNGDGTATDPDRKLMWIRGAWGMIWDGKACVGDPIRVSWLEATHLFGLGTLVSQTSYADLLTYLSPAERGNGERPRIPARCLYRQLRWVFGLETTDGCGLGNDAVSYSHSDVFGSKGSLAGRRRA